MGFAEGVAAGDQRDGLFVVHRHAGESLADVLRRGGRIRLAVRPFGIDVDQAHLHGAERLRKLTVATGAGPRPLLSFPLILIPPLSLPLLAALLSPSPSLMYVYWVAKPNG